MKCKRCQHEDYVHEMCEGRCKAHTIKYDHPYVKMDDYGNTLNAYASAEEIEIPCPCPQFTLTQQQKSRRHKRGLLSLSPQQYAKGPKSHFETHNHYPL